LYVLEKSVYFFKCDNVKLERSKFMKSKAIYSAMVLLISILLTLSYSPLYAEEVRGVTDTTIKIGAILDQTGPIAGDITLPAAEGFRNYARHVNDKGGIFGRKIKVIVEDDHYSIPAGIAAFKKLLFKDEIFALLGPGNTGGGKGTLWTDRKTEGSQRDRGP